MSQQRALLVQHVRETKTLLQREAGEFSANIYVRTPLDMGGLRIYPAQQYTREALPVLTTLVHKLQDAYVDQSQAYIRGALPIERKVDVADGDLVLINTGRFHGVEPFDELAGGAYRLSGQCWLSYRQGKPLRMWV